jgi:glycosyltransferase involved in cell wall biosynthesis
MVRRAPVPRVSYAKDCADRREERDVKVLLLTQVLPFPPDSGPKVKTWNLIKWLAAERHEVTLASFVRGESERELGALRRYCRAVHPVPLRRGALRDGCLLVASLASGEPFFIRRDRRRAMRRLVERLARETRFDVVHADQLNMAQYAQCVPGGFTVLDAHNALWLLYKRLAATASAGPRRRLLEREWRRLHDYEGRIGRAVDAVLAVSAEDRDALRAAMGADVDIRVVPIAVDPVEVGVLARRPDADRLVHLGTMYWPPNVDGVRWFVRSVFPLIRAARPDAAFDVIGARPPRAIRALARPGSGVRVTGYVDDPTPYLERAAVMVVPVLAGSGMRVKILNALAQGLPVVTTALGCEGIAAQAGTHLLVADHPDEFAAATLRVLGDRGLAETLARNGRRLIETRYDYRQAYAPLAQVYERAVHDGAAAARMQA